MRCRGVVGGLDSVGPRLEERHAAEAARRSREMLANFGLGTLAPAPGGSAAAPHRFPPSVSPLCSSIRLVFCQSAAMSFSSGHTVRYSAASTLLGRLPSA